MMKDPDMKKTVFVVLIITALIVGVFIVKRLKRSTTPARYTIGILQTASHPALDASREGFMQELQRTLNGSVAFVIQNAQGSVAQAHTIAQQFHANSAFSAFFTIATPATQAMGALEKKRPIFMCAVTDPAALGLMHATTNMCGTNDMIDVEAEIEMAKRLVPHAKTAALLYTSGETNSVILAERMRRELQLQNILPVDFAMSNESDIQAMVELACRKTDVIITPNDNTISSAITLVAGLALKYKKPLIVSDNMLVKHGALAARGVDYKASGVQTARIAYHVLVEGKKPYELPIETAQSEQIFINQQTLTTLGLTLPKAFGDRVTLF